MVVAKPSRDRRPVCTDLNRLRGLAACDFAIITGFNLSLHRRGKRVDPSWEATKNSMTPLIDRALEMLG